PILTGVQTRALPIITPPPPPPPAPQPGSAPLPAVDPAAPPPRGAVSVLRPPPVAPPAPPRARPPRPAPPVRALSAPRGRRALAHGDRPEPPRPLRRPLPSPPERALAAPARHHRGPLPGGQRPLRARLPRPAREHRERAPGVVRRRVLLQRADHGDHRLREARAAHGVRQRLGHRRGARRPPRGRDGDGAHVRQVLAPDGARALQPPR